MSSHLFQKILVYAVPVLFSIVIHEVAHGWMAHRLGDDTAKNMGRLTLNPVTHIDIMGTVILPLIMIILGGPVFGWAKPVPFNPNNFHRHVNVRNGIMWVAIAGPASNLVIAFMSAFFFVLVQKFFPISNTLLFLVLSQLAQALIIINLILASLNLLPIPPLDGSKILLRFLPQKYERHFFMLERYGFIILILLLASGVLSKFISGFVHILYVIVLLIPKLLFS